MDGVVVGLLVGRKKATRAMCVTFICGGYLDYLTWQFKTRLLRLQSFFSFLFFSTSKHGALSTGRCGESCHRLSLVRMSGGGGGGAYCLFQ